MGCVRRVLRGEGWPARSWQQDGLLVEDVDGRQLRRGGGGGVPAVGRLEAAMRRAEAAVLEQEGMEIGLLVKDFFEGSVEAVLQRMAGRGGRRPGVMEARGAARQARAAGGGRAPPPPRTPPAEAGAAAAGAQATRAERAEAALAAEMEGLARERRDTMTRRRQERLGDALVAAADEPAVHETEAGGEGAADAADGRGGAAGARKRRRGEGESEGEGGSEEGDDDEVAAGLTTGGDDSVRATGDEARGDGGEAVTSGGDAGDDHGDDDDGDGDHSTHQAPHPAPALAATTAPRAPRARPKSARIHAFHLPPSAPRFRPESALSPLSFGGKIQGDFSRSTGIDPLEHI